MKHTIPIKAVIIDNDVAICRQLEGWLASAAYDVSTFTDPIEGLNHITAMPSGLALVDLRLPRHDGVDVIESLKRTSPDVRVLAMSAFPDASQVRGAFNAGACELIHKPMTRSELIATLDRQMIQIGITARTESEFNRRLGGRLRELRKAGNRTQCDVASACQITAAQLSQIELGKTATSTWTLARICGSLRVPLSTLFKPL
jgi:DNA-binding NtrC family response regulator